MSFRLKPDSPFASIPLFVINNGTSFRERTMVRFQFLPAETKFYDWFEKATANLLDAAQQLQDLFDHYDDVENRVGPADRTGTPGGFHRP